MTEPPRTRAQIQYTYRRRHAGHICQVINITARFHPRGAVYAAPNEASGHAALWLNLDGGRAPIMLGGPTLIEHLRRELGIMV